MPEVVADFIENKDFKEVRKIQKQLLLSYEQDFSNMHLVRHYREEYWLTNIPLYCINKI